MDESLKSSLPTDWERHFYAKTLAKARAIHRSGKVLSWQPAEDGAGMTSVVQGSQSEPYAQGIEWGLGKKNVSFVSGSCTCPMESNCKHVAAAIFAVVKAGGVVLSATQVKAAVKPRISDQLQNGLEPLQQAAAPPPPEPAPESADDPERLVYILNL